MDLPAALGTLADRYHVNAVRVDAGGILNAHLIAAGPVDEIDIIVALHLAGTGGPSRSIWSTVWPGTT